jgi:hypothetical protein
MTEDAISETDNAYLAGIIDGEGSITITHRLKGKQIPRTMRLQVYNTDMKIMDWLVSKYGGAIHKNTPKNIKGKNKAVMMWYVSTNNASFVLKSALKYLIIKKNQAMTALEFHEKFKSHHSGARISDDEILERIAFDRKLRMMKHE